MSIKLNVEDRKSQNASIIDLLSDKFLDDLRIVCRNGSATCSGALLCSVSSLMRSVCFDTAEDREMCLLLADFSQHDVEIFLNCLKGCVQLNSLSSSDIQTVREICRTLGIFHEYDVQILRDETTETLMKIKPTDGTASEDVDQDQGSIDKPVVETGPSVQPIADTEALVTTGKPTCLVPPKRRAGRPKKGNELKVMDDEKYILTVSSRDGTNMFQCAECHATFNRKWSIRLHVRKHSNDKPYSCEEPGCEAKFARPQNLWRHKKTHTQEKSHVCPVCSRGFCERKDMLNHLVTHDRLGDSQAEEEKSDLHGSHLDKDAKETEENLSCPLCGVHLKSKRTLDIHLLIHQEQRRFKCQVSGCDQVFSMKTALLKHKRCNHVEPEGQVSADPPPDTEVKKFKCAVCGKRLKTRQNLELHSRQHTGEKTFKCGSCDASYYTASSLRNHETSRHLGVQRTFLCTFCGKSFNKKDNLDSHVTLHTGEKKYSCPHCEKKFRSHSVYQNHLRYHAGKKEFVCQYCGKPFMQKSHLQRHAAIHTGVRNHQCPVCLKTFIESGDVKKHMKTHQKEAEWSSQHIPYRDLQSKEGKLVGVVWEETNQQYQESLLRT